MRKNKPILLRPSMAASILCLCTVPSAAWAQQDREPIVTDDELEQAVRDASSEEQATDAPLETIEEWEQRFDAQLESANSAQEQPLQALEEFNAQPIEDGDFVSEIEGQEVRFGWAIDGLDTLNNASVANAIEARFEELSILSALDGKAPALASLRVSASEDQEVLRSLFEAYGFYDASVDAALSADADMAKVAVALAVTAGSQYRLGDIVFSQASPDALALIADNFGLETGSPIIAEDVLSGEASIAVSLPQNGYPFAAVGQRDILLNESTGTGDYTLPVATGSLHYFGAIQTEDGAVFDADHVQKLARFQSGEVFDSRRLNDLRAALVQTGILANVSVEPISSDDTAEDGTKLADLLVRQEAGAARSLAGSIGYATGQGFRAEGSWTHRNLFPPQGALIANAVAGTQEQGAGVTFRRSNAGRRDRTVELGLSALHTNYDAFDAYTGRLVGRVSYDSTPLWRKKFTYAYGFELLGSSETDFDFDLGRRDRETFYVAALPGQIGLDRTDSLLDPSQGFKLILNVSPEASLGTGSQVYVRSQLDASGYVPFGESFVLAGRVRFGATNGIDREDLAPSRRFYGGGGGSVRGFGFQELGPRDPNNDPIGGLSTNEASAEIRYRFGDFGIVAFADAGQVYEESLPQFSDWRFGVGLGARYYSAFGPFRLDVATPINRQTGESQIAVYVSIGQAF